MTNAFVLQSNVKRFYPYYHLFNAIRSIIPEEIENEQYIREASHSSSSWYFYVLYSLKQVHLPL